MGLLQIVNKQTGLTKNEAMRVMEKGYRVSHVSLTAEEWMEQLGCRYTFEDGVTCLHDEFWAFRTSPSWNYDWKIVGECHG